MNKICILGNSHVGSVKKALTEFSDIGGLDGSEITIFGSNRNTLKSAAVRNGRIHSEDPSVQENFRWTSGGQSEIVISDFDEILFLVGPPYLDLRPFSADHRVPFLSSAIVENIWAHTMQRWQLQLAKAAAEENEQVRVTYIGKPYASCESPAEKALLEEANAKGSNTIRYAQKARSAFRDFAAELKPSNLQFMEPPQSALEEHGLFTRHEFCRDSVRLSEDMSTPHPTTDFKHMNAAYGKLLLEKILA